MGYDQPIKTWLEEYLRFQHLGAFPLAFKSVAENEPQQTLEPKKE
jgi:hypothetical protein